MDIRRVSDLAFLAGVFEVAVGNRHVGNLCRFGQSLDHDGLLEAFESDWTKFGRIL